MLKKYKRPVAIFLLFTFATNIFAPTVSWALTSGPTAPEATSFEPVDTTDMISLSTGDLVYNIPLLEVPGPGGGYPLALSYHAGIMPNEESSWVGLGWSLSPGAITRNVNGFADDHKNVNNSTRYFWEGGETETYKVGVTVGLAGTPASFSAGLAFSQDTYRGFGVGGYMGVGSAIGGEGSPFGVKGTIGVSPYGDHYATAGLEASSGQTTGGAIDLSIGMSVSTNFETVATTNYASMDVGPLGVTMRSGSQGVTTNVSVAGVSFVQNSNSGRVSSYSDGFSFPIPIIPGKLSLSFGYEYERYWIDELDNVTTNGALYYQPFFYNPGIKFFDNVAYDSYSLFDHELPGGIIDNPDPEKVLGGSFPSYDNYAVHAQGLAGQMRPYQFHRHLKSRNKHNKNAEGEKVYEMVQYYLGNNPMEPSFRFINDFSNRFEYTDFGTIRHLANDATPFEYNFGGTVIKGESGSEPYNNNVLPGSRHIEWLTNSDILNRTDKFVQSKFVETRSTGFARADKSDALIGGFVITNESGIKYHFALPAYSYKEYFYSENNTKGQTYNEYKKPEPYAYTWYLTAITGPDYVDRNGNGRLDDLDWGYWVEFEYGKWTEVYHWRNPAEGMRSDVDSDFENFSEGRKELYYLDAIRTKTHTALFFKDIRNDAKSALEFLPNIGNDKELVADAAKAGGFTPREARCDCIKMHFELDDLDVITYADNGYINYKPLPTSTLKLSSIVLIDNKSLNQISLAKTGGASFEQRQTYTWTVESNDYPSDREQCNFSPITIDHHLYRNVYDIEDFRSDLQTNALRVIEFGTDYSLLPETSNSFDFFLIDDTSPSVDDSYYTRTGKLTLNEIKFFGKQKADLMPSLKFNYDLEEPFVGTAHFTKLGLGGHLGLLTLPNSGLEAGDIITYNTNDGRSHYAVITKTSGDLHSIKYIGKNTPPASGTYKFRTTKNAPYKKDAYDIWGMYKSDYTPFSNEYASRIVSDVSAKGKDVWSLRSVSTPTGAKVLINYESDSYRQPITYKANLLRIKQVSKVSSTLFKITLYDDIPDLTDGIKQNDVINYSFDFASAVDIGGEDRCLNLVEYNLKSFVSDFYTGELVVKSVYKESGDWVIETQTNFNDYLAEKPDWEESVGPCLRSYMRYQSPIFVAGNLSHPNKTRYLGGDLRVTSIQVKNIFNSSTTSYYYQQDGDEAGVTSYEPYGLEQVVFLFPSDDPYFENAEAIVAAKNRYRKNLYSRFTEILMNAREVPPPGVTYEYVTVRESVTNEGIEKPLPHHTAFQFEVFDKGMVGIYYENELSGTFTPKNYISPVSGDPQIRYDKRESRNVLLKDYTSRIGSLKKVTVYHEGSKITETVNHYLHDGIEKGNPDANKDIYEERLASYNSQGVIEETFTDARFAKPKGSDNFSLQGILSKREQFPAIPTGQTVTNFKSGIKTTINNERFDFYSGQVVKTKQTDGYGNTFITEITPAYRQYGDGKMGLAATGGKNMLIQEAASYTYKIDPSAGNAITGLAGAAIQTWSDKIPVLSGATQPGIWRKHASYSYVGDNNVPMTGDGLHPLSSLPSFNAWDEIGIDPPAGWQKNGETRLYNGYSNVLAVSDLNNHYAATKMSLDNTQVYASVANSNYEQCAYAGAEDGVSGNGNLGGGVIYEGSVVATAHTGNKAIQVNAGQNAFTYMFNNPAKGDYHVSVWCSQSTANIQYRLGTNGSVIPLPVTTVGQAGEWYLLEAKIPVSIDAVNLTVWCKGSIGVSVFDDFRFHPSNASMVSYVYNKWGELTHILNNNNLYTRYEYDGMGRLHKTYRESFKSETVNTSIVNYHYSGK